MAATLGVTITPQGLAKRFTPTTAAWLKQVLEVAVTHVIAAAPVAIPLLQRFTAVAVQDSTVIVLPEALQQVWRGCGGGKSYVSAAGIKLQVRLDLTTGVLQGPLLQDGRVHDLLAPHKRARYQQELCGLPIWATLRWHIFALLGNTKCIG